MQVEAPRAAPFMFQPDVSHTKHRERTNLATFNRAIERAARQGDVALCLHFAADMKEAGVQPDVTTYNQLITAVATDNRDHDAWAIFDDMMFLGIKPNADTFHALLQAHKQKPSVHIWDILAKMEEMDVEPNAAINTYVLRFFAKDGCVEFALGLFQEAKAKNLLADFGAASLIVRTLALSGHPKLAIELAEAFEEETLRRLETSVWMSCLTASAEDLWVSDYLWRMSFNNSRRTVRLDVGSSLFRNWV